MRLYRIKDEDGTKIQYLYTKLKPKSQFSYDSNFFVSLQIINIKEKIFGFSKKKSHRGGFYIGGS